MAAETPASASANVTTASASQILAAAQSQPGSPVQPAVAQGFASAAGALRPQFSAAAIATEPKLANVLLPQLCTAALHLADVASGVAVDISLNGALPVPAQAVGGYVVYPSAFGAGGTVLHRVLPGGSEDYIAMPTRPAAPEVDYSLALGTGIAGLRLISGTLEMLDASGTPRLHVSPPYIVGADGTRTDGVLAVSGCAVDNDPSGPWGRPVTAPGASICTVSVTWPDASVVYPAVLDPRWTTTGSMGTARFEHTLLLLSTGKALAAGGRSTTSGTTGLTTAELYDPTSGTWSPTGSMAHGRRLHSMTQLGSSSNGTTSGKVLVAGGISGTTSTNSAELYSPSAGTWIAAGNLDVARHAHTATLLPDGRVLAAGGLNGTTMLTTAALYNPASGAGSWVATTGPVPPGGIKNHTATLIQTTNTQLNNHVLLVGGNNGTSTVSAVYLFDPVQNAFSTLASIPSPPRELHTAVTLTNTNGKILVAGGKNGSTVLASAIVFDPSFSNGTWSSAGTMTSPRVGHSMTQLPSSIVANGQLLVAGGSSTGSDTLSSAELFSGTSTWTVTPSMPGPLQGQQAVLLGGNMVLVAGGLSSTSTVQTAVYLYDASFGLGCTSNSQCSSGFCSSGICCNTACTGTCGACNLAGHLGTCTALASGTVCRASAGACDVAETCNGAALTCPSDSLAPSTTVCRAAAGECDVAETCTGTSASCPADTKKTSGTACTDDGNACTKDQCDGTTVTCQHPVGNAGTVCRASAGACDVAETCTGTSATCPADGFAPASTVCRASAGSCDVAETCTGGSAACPADGFLPSTTICRASTGQCDLADSCPGNAATCPADGKVPDGTTCNDGNACTTADACHAGSCSGTTVTCTAQDQCHTAGMCNPSTGACSNPPVANGTTCNDGNACTTGDACHAGSCSGTTVTCTAQDQCHAAGTCNQSTGACSNPPVANGTACNDGNACTTGDSCQAGTCSGTAVTCTAQDQCHTVGTCNQTTGVCSNPPVANGTTCNDNNACTTADACQGGTCTGTTVTCSGADQCHTVGACIAATGCPAPVAKANGSTCDDGNACTTGDSCQAGSCLSGASTRVALSIVQNFGSFQTSPQLTGILSSNPTSVVPGDLVTFNFPVTNTGAFMRNIEDMTVTNTGTAPFVWGSYQVTMEYLSAVTQQWIPIAESSFDANGVQTDSPPLLHIDTVNLVGSTIAPGQQSDLNSTEDVTLPSDLINLLGDPAEASEVRVEIHIDTGAGTPGIITDRDITESFTNGDTTARSVPAEVAVEGNAVTLFVPLTTADVAPGATVVLTGSGLAPLLPARGPNETDAQYLGDLRNNSYEVLQVDFGFDGNGRIFLPVLNPVLIPQKSGPPQANAGFTLPYTVQLQNAGGSAATSISVVDTVNGGDIGAQVTIPPSIAAGTTLPATFGAASPVGQTPGPYADQAVVTWQDRNGNIYGPLSSAFTTNLAAGHPEGYLTLLATGAGGPQIIGAAVTLTATALDQFGNPVANLPVSLVISGVNGRSVPLVTGADGTASFSYDGPNLGSDTAKVTATINGPTLQASVPAFTWASSVGPPCTGRTTPLDVMVLLDASPSMFTDDQIDAANAATNSFINDLDFTVDQVGSIVFSGNVPLSAQLTSDPAQATSETDAAFSAQVHACDGICAGGTDYLDAFKVALTELQGPRHRAGSQQVIVLLSDGGFTGDDPAAEIAAVKAAGVRVIALGYGSNVKIAEMKQQVASTPNDYFYAPSVGELGWIFGSIDQDTCRTLPPLVSAGGNQDLYEVRLPNTLTLQGEVHSGGPRGDVNLTSTWTEVSGPAPVTFTDPTSPVTNVLFTDPGTYILQLEASDGFLTTADRATVTVDPAPSLVGANLAVALSSPGPLTVGTPEALSATLTAAQAPPIGNCAEPGTGTGANPVAATLTTNAAGIATFTYTGVVPGTDTLQTTAFGGTAQLAAAPLAVTWTTAPPGSGSGGIAAQGWLGAPGQQTTVMGLVPVTVAAGVTVASGTLTYWPANTPTDTHVLTANAHGGPGATLATFDTTTLPNGGYIIDLAGTDNQGNQQDNRVLVTVAGDYKPGRMVVDITEFTVPVAGLPITVGRRYDSLNREKIGDFGNGWALTIGHPDLQVDPGNNVTITMPNGRRATFAFGLQPAVVGAVLLGFIATPVYIPEPGVFGTLTSDGCSPLTFDPTAANPSPICFASLFDPTALQYAPTTYKYTDPYGVVYTMGADGTLKTIQDRNNNILTFSPNGIVASTGGAAVSFTRDAEGRIAKILTPTNFEYDYTYDAPGNLIQAEAPPQNVFAEIFKYGYDGDHRLLTTTDPAGHPARTSTYDDAGRLATDKDPLSNVTTYAYDPSGHTTTTTYPDTGVIAQTFDDRGLLLSQTDQLGRTTTHVYDANRNELKRTNARGEVTTYTYDGNGNQTSATNQLSETTTTTYNAFSEPLTTTNPIGNTTTVVYDDNGLPTSFTDSMGQLATFTSGDHGLPESITDVAGNTVALNYDAFGNLTERTDRLGRVTSYQYDGMGRKTATIDPRNGTTSYQYNEDGDLLVTTNQQGFGMLTLLDANRNVGQRHTANDTTRRQQDYSYDADNHLSLTTNNDDGSTIQQIADFRGNVLSVTDEVGNKTTYKYDLAGQLVQTNHADGTFTAQGYDLLGRLTSKTDERHNTTTYAYEPGCDCKDRLTSVTDPLGRTTSTTYDGMSRKTSTTDAAGNPTFYAYDLRGHLIETDYIDGTNTHDTYDPSGRRTASTDQTDATTFYGYDAEGQLISVTDPLKNVTQYGYDLNGNLTSVTDANNHTTTYAYDSANRKTSRTLPMEMKETFGYDEDDNVVSHTDFRNKTANYTFDRRFPSGRASAKIPDASLGEPTVTYAYNANSTRSSMVDASGTTTYGYDLRNRLRSKATPEGTLTYTYDATGNMASIDSSNTDGTSVTYAWDVANQLVSVTDNRLGGMTTAAYTATGRPSSLAQPNGVSATYAYDSLDRALSMAWKKAAGPAFASWAYTYNPRGQRLTSTEATGREATYAYDVASRLASETITGDPSGASGNGALTYSIDPVGNRLTRTSTLTALGAQSFGYDVNDELTTDSYDANGNTTNSGGHTYTYDFENRLVTKDSGAVTVVYDGDGNRVAKAVGGSTTNYLVDDLNPTGYLQVMDEVSGGAVQVRYTFGNMLVSQTRTPGASAATSFYGYDAHRNIAFLSDVSGAQTDTYTYDAWGNLIASTGNTPNTRLYEGQEFDPDIGLINLRARQYSASTGRFFTLDPLMGQLMKPTSLNRYLSADADPENLWDPNGSQSAIEYAAMTVALAQVVLIHQWKSRPPDIDVCLDVGTVGGIATAALETFPGYGTVAGLTYEALCLVLSGIVSH